MSSDSDNPNFEDESFDLNELEQSSGEFVVFLHNGDKIQDPSLVSVKKYDFTNPIVLSDKDLGQLKTKSQEFAHHLSATYQCF